MASWSASRKVTMVFPKRHGKSCPTRVVFSRRDAENAEDTYAYDGIGNLLESSSLSATNLYSANCLNQYASISNLCASAPLRELSYDLNGNLTTNILHSPFSILHSYSYDTANRLKTVSSNGVLLVTSFYDAQGRRVRKITPEATTTFFYDDWNLVEERIENTNGTSSLIRYCWGRDLSGNSKDAGGIGGLLYVSICNSSTPNSSTQQLYVPFYDNNGNITHYCDAQGNVVASYTYDAFGNTVSQSGPMADDFAFRFSTKYYDSKTGLYYYGYRYYSPMLMRWLNRDPIEEQGGVNLYVFCGNGAMAAFDPLGRKCTLVSGPRIKADSYWELEKIKFKSVSDSGNTLIYGVYGYWRILGEADCSCRMFWSRKQCIRTKNVYKKKTPQDKEDFSAIDPFNPELFTAIPNPAALPLEIPFFTSIKEGFPKSLRASFYLFCKWLFPMVAQRCCLKHYVTYPPQLSEICRLKVMASGLFGHVMRRCFEKYDLENTFMGGLLCLAIHLWRHLRKQRVVSEAFAI